MSKRFLMIAMAILLIAGVWGSVLAQTGDELIPIYRAFLEAVNAHDADLAVSYLADDLVYDAVPTPPPMDKEAFKAFLEVAFAASSDLQTIEHRILASGNTVVAEGVWTGTFQNEWLGIPGTGKPYEYGWLDIVEFEGDKIKRVMDYYDIVIWMMQVGVMPPSELPPLEPSFELPEPDKPGLSPVKAAEELDARWDAHDLPGYVKLVHSDAEILIAGFGVPMDRATYIASQELYHLAFPDANEDLIRTVDMGEGWVLVEAVFTGTNDGPYFGIPATGLPVTLRAGILQRFDADGLMTDCRIYFDNLTMLVQMGLVELPAPSALLPTTWGQLKSLFQE